MPPAARCAAAAESVSQGGTDMVPVMSLCIPILLSAVLVFIVSSILHMMLPWHRGDMKQLPSEDSIMEAFRRANVPPGDYMVPYCDSMKHMKDPAFLEKRNKGPIGMMTIVKGGPPSMGSSLVQWFLYSLLVGVFAALSDGSAARASVGRDRPAGNPRVQGGDPRGGEAAVRP